MKSFDLQLPVALIDAMERFPDHPWNEIIRMVIEDHLSNLSDSLVEKSEFTEEDAVEFGRKISQAASKEFLKS